jgi:mono/diheme cytochrome c family protein
MRLLLGALLLLSACPAPARFPPPDREAPADPATVERGRYLANHVAICVTCHSERDWRYYGGPVAPGTEGQGGESHTEIFNLPQDVSMPASNITPHNLGDWTDGEVLRSLIGGLSQDGSALFPSMPFTQYRKLSWPDLEAIVAYLRTVPPNDHPLPERDLRYRSLKDITNAFPSPASPPQSSPEPGTVAYGRYLTAAASCMWCHTPIDRGGWPIAGREFSGGNDFFVKPPGAGFSHAPNITPHATGIGGWSKEQFIGRFKRTDAETVRKIETTPGGFNSMMAWEAYSGLTEDDLGAIYDFLMTRRPIENMVPRWTPPEIGLGKDL